MKYNIILNAQDYFEIIFDLYPQMLPMLFHKFVRQTATRRIEIRGKKILRLEKSKEIRISHANPTAEGGREWQGRLLQKANFSPLSSHNP